VKWLIILVLVGSAFGQTPVLFYSDLPTATCTAASPNGVGNKGAIVTITGEHFGSSQGGSVAKLGSVTLDSYLLWSDTKIAFQPSTTASGCPAVGNYNVSVVTGSGTSNALVLHIYSGATIYFVDNVSGHNGSDSNNGKYSAYVSGTDGPFLTMTACRVAATAAAGNLCYAMPGSWFSGSDNGYSAVLTVYSVHGTSSAYMGIIGYPTANPSLIAQLGCLDASGVGCTFTNSEMNIGSNSVSHGAPSYLVIANFVVHHYSSTPGYHAIELGHQDNNQTPHHIRMIDIDASAPLNDSFSQMLVPVLTTYSQFYGFNCHDVNNTDNAAQHTGCIYIGDASSNDDFGWSTIDMSCSIAGTCSTNKGIEVHSTGKQFGVLPGPAFQSGSSSPGDIAAAGGGSLTAGIYDVLVTYRSRLYYGDSSLEAANWIPDVANCFNLGTCHSKETESDNSNVVGTTVKVTLTGAAGSNAIAIKWPTGIDHRPPKENAAEWDGASVLCNPTLAYKVYVCKEGSSCTSGPLYQGQNAYTDPSAGLPITSTDYLLTSLGTTSGGPNFPYTEPTLDGSGAPQGSLSAGQHYKASMSGCNIRNISIHDTRLIAMPGYMLTLYGIGIDSGSYFRVWNTEFINAGTGWGWNQQDQYRVPVCLNNPNNDVDMRDYASGGDMEFANNTFFNCGGPTDAYNTPGVMSAEWYSVSGYPSKRYLFTNNIFRQPTNYGARDGWITTTAALTNLTTNFSITGSNNVCYGFSGSNCTGTNYNFNGLSTRAAANPLFTSEGTLVTSGIATTFCAGGLDCYPTAYTGYNLYPQSGSPVWGAGTAVAYVTRDINGLLRSNPPSIGPYESSSSTTGVSVSGVALKGVVIH
jgi:hypothetical protein